MKPCSWYEWLGRGLASLDCSLWYSSAPQHCSALHLLLLWLVESFSSCVVSESSCFAASFSVTWFYSDWSVARWLAVAWLLGWLGVRLRALLASWLPLAWLAWLPLAWPNSDECTLRGPARSWLVVKAIHSLLRWCKRMAWLVDIRLPASHTPMGSIHDRIRTRFARILACWRRIERPSERIDWGDWVAKWYSMAASVLEGTAWGFWVVSDSGLAITSG